MDARMTPPTDWKAKADAIIEAMLKQPRFLDSTGILARALEEVDAAARKEESGGVQTSDWEAKARSVLGKLICQSPLEDIPEFRELRRRQIDEIAQALREAHAEGFKRSNTFG